MENHEDEKPEANIIERLLYGDWTPEQGEQIYGEGGVLEQICRLLLCNNMPADEEGGEARD